MASKKLALEWKKSTSKRFGVEYETNVDSPTMHAYINCVRGEVNTQRSYGGTTIFIEEGMPPTKDNLVILERALRDHLKPYAELYNKLVAVHGEGAE